MFDVKPTATSMPSASSEARLKSAERPKGVLIKYRELLRTAARDEATLTKLNQMSDFGAEQARKEDPWELISNPTLLDTPVAPQKTHGHSQPTRRTYCREWSRSFVDRRSLVFRKTVRACCRVR